MYKLEVFKQAAKYYGKLDKQAQRRINKAVDDIIENPHEGSHMKKLKGRLDGKFRYDIGNLRAIYCIDVDNGIIYLEAIGPRGDVYK